MPLRSSRLLRERAAAGVEICLTHGANCEKYPDHPLLRERSKPDMELAEMIRRGLQKLGKSIPQSPQECKTRKLSDEEIRQRREWAKAVLEARLKKGQGDPMPPWEMEFDHDLAERIRWGRAAQAREIHTTDVREGYGDAAPELQEEE